MNAIHNFIRRLLRAAFLPKVFACAALEQCIEFKTKDGSKRAYIWAKQPDGDAKFRYTYYLASKLSESQLREIEKADDKLEKAHQFKRYERDFKFFEPIFSRCSGYTNEEGRDIGSLPTSEQIAYLRKWFPDHIERVVYFMFDEAIAETICKKKD